MGASSSSHKKFVKYLKIGDLVAVTRVFQPDFLERPGTLQMRPIHIACTYGQVDIVKFLIDHNCDIECAANKGMKPIHLACTNGHVDVVKLLVQHKCYIEYADDSRKRSIHLACTKGYIDIVQFLVEHKCDIECDDILGRRPIHDACINGHVDIVQFLVERQCAIECVDNKEWRPIHAACNYGHVDIVQFLVECNCDIECDDTAVRRPIHRACANGYVDIVKFLVERKCNIECEDILGMRPIHHSCKNGKADIVQVLVELKCNIECEDNNKWRPIHYACFGGHIGILKILVDNNCDLQCEGRFTSTPLYLAVKMKHQACQEFLTKVLGWNQVSAPNYLPILTKAKKKVTAESYLPVHKQSIRKSHIVTDSISILEDKLRTCEEDIETAILDNMLMISYCQEDEQIVKAIYEELITRKYKVWIDFENMGNDLIQSMAVAVEDCKAVIVCASSSYQRSACCRQEMNYAQELKKCIVPILVEKEFTPTEWLGIGLAELLKVNMVGKYDFKKSVSKLTDHLDRHVFNK